MKLQSGEGYCIKCKRGQQMKERYNEKYKNGTPVEKGRCVSCGTKMTRMMNREEAVRYEARNVGSEEGNPD